MAPMVVMMAVTAAVSVIGGVISAAGAASEAAAKEKAANYNIAIAERNRQIQVNQGASDIGDLQLENRRQLGAIRAAYGASGLAMEGTPLDVLEATATEQQLNVEKIRYKSRIGAMDESDKIEQFKMQREAAKSAGNFGVAGALLKGFGGAASSFAGSFGGGSSLSRGAEIGGR